MNVSARREWRSSGHLVALTALGLTCAPATLPVYTLGLFVTPLQDAFGWSRGTIQAAILFSTGLGLIGGPLAGWIVRRMEIRLTVISGLMGMALSLALCAAMSGAIWQLYAAYALMSLLGAGANAVGWSSLIAMHFPTSRGLALGLALSGTGLSAILMPRVAAAGLGLWGWQGAYLSLALFTLIVVLPACLMFLPRRGVSTPVSAQVPANLIEGPAGMAVGAALKTRHFWLIGLSTSFIYMAVGGIIPNLVPALKDKGIATADALSIMSILGFAIIGGRIAVGVLIDRYWAPAVAALVLLPAAGACLVLNTSTTLGVYGLAAAAIGLVTGMEFDMLAFLVARYFGLADYARIYGRFYMFLAAAAGIAPFMFGAVYDRSHSYGVPLVLSALLLAAGALGMLALGRYPKLRTVEP